MAVVKDQSHFNEMCVASGILGTLQAAYTDFIYLSEGWRKNAEDEALLGCSMTGICDNINTFYNLNLQEGASKILEINQAIAAKIGINRAKRATAIKPEGTNSLFLGGVAPGAHPQHDPFFIRRFTLDKPTALYKYLKATMPELVEDSLMNKDQAYFCAPMAVDKNNSIFRNEPLLAMLERVKYLHQNWIQNGHVEGENTHNVSATVSVKDDEWDQLAVWMWDNKDFYSGLALMPYMDSSYPQLIYQTIDEQTFNEKAKLLKPINLDEIKILAKDVNLAAEPACAGGACLV
jgi:ribonucleoside-diphosphate reductase alpha chain